MAFPLVSYVLQQLQYLVAVGDGRTGAGAGNGDSRSGGSDAKRIGRGVTAHNCGGTMPPAFSRRRGSVTVTRKFFVFPPLRSILEI